jgi:hypothetical protein
LVLHNKEYKTEFHEKCDDFVKKVMTLDDRNLVCRYMQLAMVTWGLPMKWRMIPSWERFHALYGSHIRGTAVTEPGDNNSGSIWKNLFG